MKEVDAEKLLQEIRENKEMVFALESKQSELSVCSLRRIEPCTLSFHLLQS